MSADSSQTSRTGGEQHEEFVSEPVMPQRGTAAAAAMARGEPGLPAAFTWRDDRYVVAKLLATWKSSTAERGELYLRRHWYRVRTTTGEEMTLYCERQARNARKPRARWWLYTLRRTNSPSDS